MVVQILMNNLLKYYGGQSSYGSEIPLACAGIISKVNMIFFAVVIGIAQGIQPIIGFNYGAGNFGRVRETYRKAVGAAVAVSTVAFFLFQTCPRQIIAIFGDGNSAYFDFAEKFFRIYQMCIRDRQKNLEILPYPKFWNWWRIPVPENPGLRILFPNLPVSIPRLSAMGPWRWRYFRLWHRFYSWDRAVSGVHGFTGR